MTNRKDLELNMSFKVPNQENVFTTQLRIDKETSFDIYYDIYSTENTDYLYIKLVENSAVAPFYYNKSYTLEELQDLHRIFKAVDLEILKSDLSDLFKEKRVKLYYEENKEKVIMELDPSLFVKRHTIRFELIKEMIPEKEKDDKLLELYDINKKQKNLAQELYALLKPLKGRIDQKVIDNLMENFDLYDKDNKVDQPCSNGDNMSYGDKDEKVETLSDEFKKMLLVNSNGYRGIIRKENGVYKAQVTLKNETSRCWKRGFIELKLDKNASQIQCNSIDYPIYDVEIGQELDLIFTLEKDIKIGKYKVVFDTYIDGELLKDVQFKLKLNIKNAEE